VGGDACGSRKGRKNFSLRAFLLATFRLLGDTLFLHYSTFFELQMFATFVRMSDYKIQVNNREIPVSIQADKVMVDGQSFDVDKIEFRSGHFHILHNNRSFTAEIAEHLPAEKSFVIKVNNNKYRLKLSDAYDDLLLAMGMDMASKKTVNNVKAPMPGLVLRVMIEPGQSISKGDTLLILEAMKMENILKAPADGIVKSILVHKGDKVEKNQVMVNMG
jgi:biotin carboxyl carrier protein